MKVYYLRCYRDKSQKKHCNLTKNKYELSKIAALLVGLPHSDIWLLLLISIGYTNSSARQGCCCWRAKFAPRVGMNPITCRRLAKSTTIYDIYIYWYFMISYIYISYIYNIYIFNLYIYILHIYITYISYNRFESMFIPSFNMWCTRFKLSFVWFCVLGGTVPVVSGYLTIVMGLYPN